MPAKVGAWFWRTKWGWLYLLFIPAFALAYDLLPANSLRDANVIYENTFNRQAERFVHELEADLARRVPYRAIWREGAGSFALVPGSFTVAQVRRPVDNKVLVVLAGEYVGEAHRRQFSGEYDEEIELPTGSLPVFGGINSHNEHEPFYYAIERVDHHETPSPPLSLLLPPPTGAKIVSRRDALIGIEPRTENAYVEFVAAAEGDPHYLAGRYWRMLYLSATTITTLGFGDITPTSGLGRFLVGFEAVAGIVCIGLFLSALANRTLRRRRQPEGV